MCCRWDFIPAQHTCPQGPCRSHNLPLGPHISLQTNRRAHQVHQSNREKYPRLTPGRGNAASKAHGDDVTIFFSFKKSKARHQRICNETTFCNLPPRFCTENKRLNKQTPSNISGLPDKKKAFSQWHLSFPSCRFIFLMSDHKNNKKGGRRQKKSKHLAHNWMGNELEACVCVYFSLAKRSQLVCAKSWKPVLTSAEVWPAIPLPCRLMCFLLSHFISH